MFNDNDLVSVIMPTFNVEKYVGQAIQSVLNQTHQNFEIIIIDDCSTDGTLRVINKFKDPRIKVWINEKNSGPSFSRNRAMQLAEGTWLAVLDSDDWWQEERLATLLTVAREYNADIVCDDLYLIVDGEEKPWSTRFFETRFHLNKISQVNISQMIDYDFGILKPLISKVFLNSNKIVYKEEIKYGEDFIFLFEFLLHKGLMVVSPRPMYYYRDRRSSLVTNRLNLLNQTLETTKWLMDKYKHHQEIVPALMNRIKKIEENLLYYQMIQPLKEGYIFKGLMTILFKQSSIKLITKRITKILNYRMLRHFRRSKPL